MKKFFTALFVLFALIGSALMLAPVFFDADKYIKPYVEKAIAENLDVDARIGHLTISFWGKAAVKVRGIDLIDKKTTQSIFKVEDAEVEFPIAPLFEKLLDLKFIAKKPLVRVVSEKSGTLNWSRIVVSKGSAPKTASGAGGSSKPEFLSDFRLAFALEIDDAIIKYSDELTGSETSLNDLDFLISNFSLKESFGYKITARLKSDQGGVKLYGPLDFEGSVKLRSSGDAFEGADSTGKIILDKTEIRSSFFEKAAGEPLRFLFAGVFLKKSAKIKIDSNIEAMLAKIKLDVKAYSPYDVVAEINAPKIDFNKLLKQNLKVSDVFALIHATPSAVTIKESRLKVFKGDYSGTVAYAISPRGNRLELKGKVSNIDINEAITSQMPDFKDSLTGRASSDYNVTTTGLTPEDYKKNLAGGGFFNLKDGAWSALYALKVIGDKLSAIPGAKEKVGDLKVGDKIQTAKSNFKFANKSIILSDTLIDMKDTRATIIGGGDVGFDKQMRFKGFILVPLGSPPPALRNSDGRAKLPFEFSGAFNGPNVNWNVTTDAVAKAYLRQEGQKLLDQVIKDNVKDENLKKILDKAPEGLDKLLKDIKL